jgi:uncharacterized protein
MSNDHKPSSQHAHPDQSPWAISVAEVGRRPGQSQDVETTLPAPSGIGDDFYGVAPDSDVVLDVRIDSITDGLLVTGDITATFSGECSRCLIPISEQKSAHVEAYFPYEPDNRDTHETNARRDYRDYHGEVDIIAGQEDDSQDVYPLSPDGNFADFEALLRDNLSDLLPAQAVCKEDCLGLCPQCGLNLNENPGHHHEVHDIRWAALEEIAAMR